MDGEGHPAPRLVAAALAFVSQGIHVWVLPGQLAAALLPGILFFLVAAGQGLLGVSLLFGGGRRTTLLGMLLNAFVVLVWLLTRAISFPTLLEPIRLPVQGLGAAATLVEVVLLVGLAMLWRTTPRKVKERRK